LTQTLYELGFSPRNENLAVSELGLERVTVPYTVLLPSQVFIHTVLSLLKPVPEYVTVTSPLLGALMGRMLEMVGEAVANGIPTITRRKRRTRETKREDRFMTVVLDQLFARGN
jgi:hypothetical protein